MPQLILIISFLTLHCLLYNPTNEKKAGNSVKSATLSYISLEETKGVITINPGKEGISLTASNATFEEILQSFADREKMPLKVYCDDPSLDSKRVSITLTSPSLRELLTQLLGSRYELAFSDHGVEPAKEEMAIKEVVIYSIGCKKKDPPVRTFVNLKEHHLLRKPYKEIALNELSKVLKEEGPSSR